MLAISGNRLAATTIGVYEVVRDPDAARLLTKKWDNHCTVLVRGRGEAADQEMGQPLHRARARASTATPPYKAFGK